MLLALLPALHAPRVPQAHFLVMWAQPQAARVRLALLAAILLAQVQLHVSCAQRVHPLPL